MTTTMVRRGRISVALLGALAMAFMVGCGGIRRIPVSGTVTLDGKPINGGNIVFSPDAAKGNLNRINCMSPIIVDGQYTLETNGVTRSESGDGVPLGWYKVTFRQMQESTKKHPVVPVNVHDRFREPEKTPLSVEVKDNPEPGAYDFKFTSK
jgi:hypothetical protein